MTKEIEVAPTLSLTAEEQQKVQVLSQRLNIEDQQSLLNYGAEIQKDVSRAADKITEGVRLRDGGEIGKMMADVVMKLKGFDTTAISNPNKLPFYKRWFLSAKKIQLQYSTVEKELDGMFEVLNDKKEILKRNMTMFKLLAESNKQFFKDLTLYIEAGEQRLKQVRQVEIPELERKVANTNDPMVAQELNELVETANRFEQKLHDLRVSQTMTIQNLVQIRMQQEGDYLLADKIQSSSTILYPAWKTKLALAIGQQHTKEALEAHKTVSDATDEMMRQISEQTKVNAIAVRQATNESLVKLDTLKQVHTDLITTMEESIRIDKEGRQKRLQVEQEMKQMNEDMVEKIKTYAMQQSQLR